MSGTSAMIMVGGAILRYIEAGEAPHLQATVGREAKRRFALPGQRKEAAQWIDAHIAAEAERAAAYSALSFFEDLARIRREASSVPG